MSSHRNSIDILWFIGQPILLNGISVPATAYIIYRLGPLQFGQWAVGASLVAATSFLTNLGLRTLFVRAVAQEPDNASAALGEQIGLRGLLSLAAGLSAIALCLCLKYPPVVLACVAINVIAQVISVIWCALADVLQSFHRLKDLAVVNLASGLALTLASIVAIVEGAGPVGLSLSYLVGPIMSVVLLSIILSRDIPIRVRWNVPRYAELLRQVRSMTAQMFVSALQERIEQLLVPKLVGISAFGYFTAGSMPANRLVMLPDGLATAYFPKIARNTVHENGIVHLTVTQLFVLSLITCVPLALLLTFLAQPIAQILFPHHAEICGNIIRITIWSIPLQGISYPLGVSLQAAGLYNEVARRSLFASLWGLTLSILLVSRFHLFGACWSLITRSAIGALMLAPLFARKFPDVGASIPVLRIAVSASLMACLLWLSTSLHLPIWLTVLGGSSVSLAGYAGCLFGLGVIKPAHVRHLFVTSPTQ